MIGVGFDLDDETTPASRSCGRSATGLRRRLAPPALCEPEHGGGRIAGGSVPDGRRRPRHRRLSIDKFEPDFYTEELAEFATAFAAQAAMAIENARLLETERAAREQAETPRGRRVAREHARCVRGLRPDPHGAGQGRSLSKRQHPAARRRRIRDSRRHGYPDIDELLRHRYACRGPDDPAWELIQRHETIIVTNPSERFPQFEDVHGEGSIKTWMAVPC